MSDSIFRIWSIARYEAKVIMRGWTFRIALLVNVAALIVLYFMRSWSFKFFFAGIFEIPSSFPYLSFMLSSGLIAIMGAFIAAESYSQFRTLDTNEAVLSRDFCLAELAIGRSAALLWAFLMNAIVVSIITLVYNMGFAKADTEFLPYLLYPFLIALPPFVFFSGFSMLVQAIGRNRAVTITAILGSMAFFMLFAADRFFYTFDVMAVKIPMLMSIHTGFEGAAVTLMQRAAWLLTGAAMAVAALLIFNRPKQSRPVAVLMTSSVPVFIVISILMLVFCVRTFTSGIELRARMVELAEGYRGEPLATPESFDIKLRHNDSEIGITTKVALLNNRQVDIDRYLFNVNPGLEVLSVESSDGSMNFTRDLQIVDIIPSSGLKPGDRDTITVICRGTIDDRACFPDADESVRWKGFKIYENWWDNYDMFSFRYSHYRFRRRHSWVQSDYALLPPHSMWYPAPGVMRGSQVLAFEHRFFAEYTIDIKTRNGLAAVSQGPSEKIGDGYFRIVPEERLPGLTLAIGRYKTRSVEVDGIDYSLSTLSSDDYFMPYADALADTMPELIRETKDWIESRVGMDYPLNRFAVVEVPSSFYCMSRPVVTSGLEYSQPGLVLAPERGYRWDTTLFNRRWHERRATMSNAGMNPLDTKASDFINMIRRSVFISSIYFPVSSWYSGVIHVESDDCPFLDQAFESYLAGKMNRALNIDRTSFIQIGWLDKANISLDGTSLKELVDDPARRSESVYVLPFKGKQLFLLIESYIGEEKLREFLAGFIWKNRWRNVDAGEFYSAFAEISGVDLGPIADEWYKGEELPGFSVEGPSWQGVLMDRGEKCQVRLTVFNREKTPGLIGVMVNPVRSPGSRGVEAERRIFRVEPGEAKELGVVTDFKARSISINTYISKNIPAVMMEYIRTKEYPYIEDNSLLDGARPVDPSFFDKYDEGIVVDNIDRGFEILSEPESSLLSRIIGATRHASLDTRYVRFLPKEPPAVWRETVQGICYGRYVKSGHYVAAGTGTGRVRWTTEIPESGTYEVYHHMVDNWGTMKPKHRKNACVQEYHFSISHDEGVDEQVLVMHECPPGWNLLGTYYFSKGKAMVELTDESPKWFIIADAVKWVKKD
jgi:hypothetical protein